MQIPSARSGDFARAAQVQRAPERAASQPAAEPARSERAAAQARGVDVPTPAPPSQRLENVSQSIGARLDHLLEHGELDETQVAAVQEAKAEFEGLLARLGNALDQGGFAQPDKAGNSYGRIIGHLRDEVHSALNPQPVEPPRSSDGGSVTVRPDAARRAGEGGGRLEDRGVSPQALSERLAKAESRIEDRLSNLRSGGMDEESAAALADAYGQFQATLERMQYGIEHGTLSQAQLGKGFRYAVDQLREGLRPTQPEGAPEDQSARADGGEPVGATPLERLGAVSDSIAARLGNLLEGVEPEAARAIGAAQEQFDSLVGRLSNALQQGLDPARAGDAFARMLGELRNDVHGALGGESPSVALYDSSLSQASLYEIGSTGLDRRG